MLCHITMINVPLTRDIVDKTVVLKEMCSKRKRRVFSKHGHFWSSNHHPSFLRAFVPEIGIIDVLSNIPTASFSLFQSFLIPHVKSEF